MDKTAVYRIPYGLYYLGTQINGKGNICVVNTVQQVTDTPLRISVTVLKNNLTCMMLDYSKVFNVGVMDMDSEMSDIAYFGQQSGKDVNKLGGMDLDTDSLGIPMFVKNCAARLSAKVVEQVDLGTHILFIGEVVDAEVLSDKTPLTYAEYRARKAGKAPKKADEPVPATYQCGICHYVYDGEIPFEELPDDYVCPICKQPKSVFAKI